MDINLDPSILPAISLFPETSELLGGAKWNDQVTEVAASDEAFKVLEKAMERESTGTVRWEDLCTPELRKLFKEMHAGNPKPSERKRDDSPEPFHKVARPPVEVPEKYSQKSLQPAGGFITAKQELVNLAVKENRSVPKLGVRAPGLSRKPGNFVSPVDTPETSSKPKEAPEPVLDERLKGIDAGILERIKNDIIMKPSKVSWDDIKGLELAKEVIQETIIYPLLRPDLFTGLRTPSKGVLLFGPPGTGKTLIARCVAKNANATFFNISASSVTSKWIGESEMLVRALFLYARTCQPSVVFIDEIDSLLSKRSENEHESSRRLKTEFLVFLDGVGTGESDQILLIGATNRPQELDEAARRRFTKRLYISLPNFEARKDLIGHHLKDVEHCLSSSEVNKLAEETDGFSGADIKSLATEASLTPMRELIRKLGDPSKLATLRKDEIPSLSFAHFKTALERTRPSVSGDDLTSYEEWNRKFGSGRVEL